MTEKKTMPVIFVGHGSPMNAIEDNAYTKAWQAVRKEIPRPSAILAVSAHWYTSGSRITDAERPKTVYDMYGFPDALYQVKYSPIGSPELARFVKKMSKQTVQVDNTRGLDHGAWSVLCKMYPDADIPVAQLSVDRTLTAEQHFQMGKEIRMLREQGVLILGSGNVVHNLARINWHMRGGYDWAEAFDLYIQESIVRRQYQPVMDYHLAGQCADLAFSSPDHFYPLLYVLGASDEKDNLTVFNNSCVLGSLSMTCYLFQ